MTLARGDFRYDLADPAFEYGNCAAGVYPGSARACGTLSGITAFVSPDVVWSSVSVVAFQGAPGALVNTVGAGRDPSARVVLTATPEPTTFALGAAGAIVLAAARARGRRRPAVTR